MRSSFTMVDFRKQLEQLSRPSLMDRLLSMMPGMGDLARTLQETGHDREMRRLSGMIDAMTPAERMVPNSIDKSRRERIARGAGVSRKEVGILIRQFDNMARMMNSVKQSPEQFMRDLRSGKLLDPEDD